MMQRLRILATAWVFAMLASATSVFADAPLFSCDPPLSTQKTEICTNPTLGRLDQTYQAVVDAALTDPKAELSPSRRNTLTTNQRSWLRDPDRCVNAPVGFTRCLTSTYLNEIKRVRAQSDAAVEIPSPFQPTAHLRCGEILGEIMFTIAALPTPLLFYEAEEFGGILGPAVTPPDGRFESVVNSALIIKGVAYKGPVAVTVEDGHYTIEAFGLPKTPCVPVAN